MWKLKFADGGSPWLRTLNNHVGRQVWEFDPKLGSPQELSEIETARQNFRNNRFSHKHSADLLMRIQLSKENPVGEVLPKVTVDDVGDVTEDTITRTLRRAISFHSTLQSHDGHWPGDYGGPMFLMPGLIITLSITGALNAVLTEEHRKEMCRYLYNHQNKDGGWGLHIEGPSTMFGSVLNYVSLRLLGEGPNDGDGEMERARDWILGHGGATYITSWGKMWLSVLGVYEWSGNNPLPPEIWLLPYMLPFHPGRMWCHCRMVYLPMSYLYGKRFVGPITPTILSLRKELYTTPYHDIDWNQARNLCAKEDLYYPHPLVQDILWASLHKLVEPFLMHWPGKKLREKAIKTAIEHIHYEDENTRYLCIGPVNKVLNMLCCWVEDPNSEAFKLHLPRIYDYLWIAEDGMKMQGYNGSQLWDTAFAVQAIISTNLVEEYGPTLRKAHTFIKNSQVLEDCPGDLNIWYRHISKGAWPFSTADHGWPISDCTAEGLKAALLLSKIEHEIVGEPLDAKRLYDAVNVILSLQAVRLNKFDYRLANRLDTEYQKLRCRVNYHALRFTNPILAIGQKLVHWMRMRSKHYIALHLRFEPDMLAFSGCDYGGGEKELKELGKLRRRWKTLHRSNPDKARRQGRCPLTPEEVGLLLRALGHGSDVHIYVASGEVYGGDETLAPLKALFPNFHSKETIATKEELEPFSLYSSRMAALDFIVCDESDVFVTNNNGNMAKILAGRRRYFGHKPTIRPNAKKLYRLFLNRSNLTWEVFASSVRTFQKGFMGEPKEVRPGRGGFHENPSTCICEDSMAKVDKISGPRKFGKHNATIKNVANNDPDVGDESEGMDIDDDNDKDDDYEDQNDLLENGTSSGTISDYENLNFEDPELEDIISD